MPGGGPGRGGGSGEPERELARTGLPIALRNFQENIASRLTGMVPAEHDIVESQDMLVIRAVSR